MKKSTKSKNSKPSSLVQIDISTAFHKWQEMDRRQKVNKKHKQYFISSFVIEVDSDSDSNNNDADETTILSEHKVSINRDGSSQVPKTYKSGVSFSSEKRNLPIAFSDDEDDELSVGSRAQDLSKGFNEHSTQPTQQKLEVTVNKPKTSTSPVASSTPKKTKNDLNNEADIANISKISVENNKATTDLSANTSCEKTELYQSPKKDKIIIKDHVILQPQKSTTSTDISNDTTICLPDRCESGTIKLNPAEKRTAGYEKDAKKTKIDSPDKKKSDTVKQKVISNKTENDILQNGKSVSNIEVSEVNNNSKKEKTANDKTVEKSAAKQASNNKVVENQSKSVKNVTTPTSSPKKKDKIDDNIPLSPQLACLKSKVEGKKINTKNLELITNLFKNVYKKQHIKNLILSDKEKIQRFFKMDVRYQFVCLKLFTWKRQWYNIHHFCNLINLDIHESDVCKMYQLFKENGIIDTNYINDDIITLLNLLNLPDLKSIHAKFKLKPACTRKEDLINNILRSCRTQSTLTNLKSTEDLIKEQIEQKMGRCMKLNEDFHDAFYRTYLLGTFTNSAFTDMQDYFRNVLHLNVLFPKYAVQDYLVFLNEHEFIRYARARKCRDELERLANNDLECLTIAGTVFTELRELKDIENYDDERFKEAPHLVQFTARSVYVSALTVVIRRLGIRYPEEAKVWLEYMIEHETRSTHRIGEWYHLLTWLYMKHLQPPNYEYASELLIDVLTKHRHHLSEVQLHELCKLGHKLKVTRKYKISQWHHDRIAELVPQQIAPEDLPSETIDALAIRENESGRKRDYVMRDAEGNRNIMKVEQIALEHYRESGYEGVHCEGILIKATFTLFFWDIIYMDLPGCFLSDIQSVPLDIHTKHFYQRRKQEIEARLKEIESGWSRPELIAWLTKMYDQHSHESGVCEVGKCIDDKNLLEVLVDCIGRQVLAKILRRLVKDFKHTRSGMPDLLVWNVDTKKAKFVEVKGEKDKLSIGQSLWIKYLQDIGADVVVCHVHSIGSKRKIIKKKDKIA